MALATFLLPRLKERKGGRSYNLPGSEPWPIIGNLNLIGTLPHRSIHELSKEYGELMLLRFGSFPTAKLILKTHDVVFIDRPKTASRKHTTYNYADITWSPYGAYWHQARRIYVTELFSARRIASFEHIRANEMRTLVWGLFAVAASSGRGSGGGDTVHLNRDHLSTLSMNVITRMVLGKRFFSEGADVAEGPVSSLSEFKWMLDELLLLNGVLNVGDWIPWVDWMDLQGYVRRMKKVARCSTRSWSTSSTSTASSGGTRARGPHHRRHGELVGYRRVGAFGAPKKTRHLRHGHRQARQHRRLRPLGNGEGHTKLPYLDTIIKETMRMHPIVPLIIPRVARDDAAVTGYDIPKGARVLINVWTIERDPELWDAAEEFTPEWFVGSKIDVKGQDFELLPFGSGCRMCPSYNLGLKVMQLSLANLLHGFT
uniref:Cytochrome P450 n=1 Tax=Oryza punctata TaxID=4537 RepID=A0A0E0LVK1_ORYPU